MSRPVGPVFFCAGAHCPGYATAASELAHPVTCAGRPRPPIVLVSCAAMKQAHAAPAAELYTSGLFRKALRFARQVAAGDDSRLRILSAKHGAVRLETRLEPYNVAAAELDPREFLAWSDRVRAALRADFGAELEAGAPVVVLAGVRYVMALAGLVPADRLGTPLAGLSVGARLQWLTRHTRSVQGELFAPEQLAAPAPPAEAEPVEPLELEDPPIAHGRTAAAREAAAAALLVKCPKCGAEPRERCRTGAGATCAAHAERRKDGVGALVKARAAAAPPAVAEGGAL